ncbi:GspH/FimT family pseudopilin [Aeromonas australiensis]|uniref:GspH/FimT family pseudopilin n=1 Tax=Aeromonas australiensis TaxID=1114880 RepID=UPI001F46BEF8|nr:GspH/FimT family pseudopilin [Aeromonas australiensis]
MNSKMMGNDKEKGGNLPVQDRRNRVTATSGKDKLYIVTERQAFADMKNAGFTLMELMIAIALGVILLGIGIPSLSNLLGSNNLATQEKSLLNHLNYARQQAISNQQTVTLCLTTTNGTDEECVTGGATRLLVFIDSDRDQKLNGSETTLTASPEFPAQLAISADTHSADVKSLRFLPDGTLASANKVTFSLCISGEKGIDIDVMPAGRAHSQTSGAVCP